MPNEFIIKNGLISQGNITVTGSVTATSITISGSSAATLGSNTFIGTEIISGSLSISGSGTPFTLNTDILEITGSLIVTGSSVVTGSLTVITGSLIEFQVTNTGVKVGNNITDTHTVTGSLSVSGSQTFIGTKTITGSVFITGSKTLIGTNTITGSMLISGSLTTTGTITATTLVVQTITSSISSITGSTNFGSLAANTHTFTGSINASGSLTGTSATFTAAITPLVLRGTNVATMWTEYYYNTSTLSGYIGSGDGLLSGANASDFIVRSQADFVVATGNNRRMTIASSTGAATFLSSIIATQGNFSLGTIGGAIGSVKNVTIANSNGAVDDWAGLNFAYYNNTTNFGYIGTVLTSTATNSAADLVFGVKSSTSATSVTEYMRMKFGGNVGIGTNNPTRKLDVFSDAIQLGDGGSFTYYMNVGAGAATGVTWVVNGTDRMRINTQGYLKASNDGTYQGATGTYHELRNNNNQPVAWITNSRTVGTEEMIRIKLTGYSPNSASSWFIYADDATTPRFYVRSDGGIGNYQANNTNLSDERTKKEITPLESYWNKFKAIEIVKFKYKDQTHDDYNIGVIAQQVESVAPEFVDIEGFGKTPEDGVPLKSIYEADLYHATIKVLQEAMAKIETLEARVQYLENK
jgi:hypothetical protein